MSRKTLHLQVSDAENIHSRLKTEKKDKEEVKNCLQPETVSALCIIPGEVLQLKKLFTSQMQKKHEDRFLPFMYKKIQEKKAKRTSKNVGSFRLYIISAIVMLSHPVLIKYGPKFLSVIKIITFFSCRHGKGRPSIVGLGDCLQI
jgi:hypothetical protein